MSLADTLLAAMRPASPLTVAWLVKVTLRKCPGATEHEVIRALVELADAGLATSQDGGVTFCR